MDLIDGMRVFAAVADAGSFTLAAERLGISKKLASKYVGQLEDRLGVRLIHRTTRTLSLTDAGARYYAGCADLLERFSALEDALRDAETGLRGTLRVTAPMTFGELHVIPLTPHFHHMHPELKIDMHLNDRYVDLANEGFDVAVRIGNLEDSGLIAKRIGTTEIWTVASPAYLERCGTPREPAELSRHTCVRDTNFRGGRTMTFLRNGRRFTVPLDGRIAVNSGRAIRELICAGHGLGVCPDFAVSSDVESGRLVRLLTDCSPPQRTISAVYLNNRNLAPKIRAYVNFISSKLAARLG